MRAVAIAAGVILLSAATWAAIEAASLSGAHLWLMVALAIGTAGGAVVLGRSAGRWTLLVIPAVLAGEASGMLATAERIIKGREQSAGVVIGAQSAAKAREARIADARADLLKHDADAKVQIAAKHCADKCKALLDETRAALTAALDKAYALPVDAAAGRSPSPLADRLGIAPWLLDLIAAGLMTVGANGLAVILIAWGAHGPVTHDTPNVTHDGAEARKMGLSAPKNVTHGAAHVTSDVRPASNEQREPSNVTPFKRPRPAPPLWGKFALEALEPDDGSRVAVKDVVAAYRGWLEARGAPVPPAAELVDHIERVFRAARIRTEAQDATIYALNVKVAAKAG